MRIVKSLKEVTEEFIGRLEELERYIIKDALTIWEAFSACCKEKCDLEPEKHVKMWPEPMLSDIEKLKNLPDPQAVDPEKFKECEAVFKGEWNVLRTGC